MIPRVIRIVFGKSTRASLCLNQTGVHTSKLSSNLSWTQFRRQHHSNECSKEAVKPISAYLQSNFKSAKNTSDVLTVELEEDLNLRFPLVWLRDNCTCADCYDSIANSRLIDQVTFRTDSVPTSTKVNSDQIEITWDDGHKSSFNKRWLCAHSFEEAHQKAREPQFHEKKEHWNAEKFQQIFKTYAFDKVMNDEATLLQWLLSLARHGVAIVNEAPNDDVTVRRLCERIAFVRKTLYQEIFYVKSQEDAKNTAYKKGKLQLHSDMPFYFHLPGTIFLHCIVQSRDGGENLLTDGFHAATKLSDKDYRSLANTVVNWSDIGSDGQFQFHSINREPVLCEDKLGNIEKINWSQPQRDTRFDVPIPAAIDWFKAMKNYATILHDPENAVTLKTEPGDILTFDNRRILHSRANYSDGARQLNGAYMDWDEIYPKIRVLRNKLNIHN